MMPLFYQRREEPLWMSIMFTTGSERNFYRKHLAWQETLLVPEAFVVTSSLMHYMLRRPAYWFKREGGSKNVLETPYLQGNLCTSGTNGQCVIFS